MSACGGRMSTLRPLCKPIAHLQLPHKTAQKWRMQPSRALISMVSFRIHRFSGGFLKQSFALRCVIRGRQSSSR